MKKRFTEEQIIQILRSMQRAAKPASCAGGTGSNDAIQVEDEVWRHGSVGCEEAEDAGMREREAEAAGG